MTYQCAVSPKATRPNTRLRGRISSRFIQCSIPLLFRKPPNRPVHPAARRYQAMKVYRNTLMQEPQRGSGATVVRHGLCDDNALCRGAGVPDVNVHLPTLSILLPD